MIQKRHRQKKRERVKKNSALLKNCVVTLVLMYLFRSMDASRLLLFLPLCLHYVTYIYASETYHTDVILLGGTGDLAKKYLWQSFFDLFEKYSNENTTFSFTGAGRTAYNEGRKRLTNIVTSNVKCVKEESACEKKKTEYLSMVKYVQLKTEDQYGDFCKNFSNKETSSRNGQVFYLSLPPSVYESTIQTLSKYCYRNDSQMWTRIVLEKPFGRDLQSAQQQANTLSLFVPERDIYRIDHYLGKSVVKQILSFRFNNIKTLEPLLTRQHVDRVEIVMKETVGVKGRVEFYNQVGVIRDVLQNHLSEMLALVTMELPKNLSDSRELEECRLRVLSKVRPLKKTALLTGQYSKYLDEAVEAGGNISQSKSTPTFAAALLKIENSRWTGIPFILMSGKMLDERTSYIRVIFRERVFCVSGCTDGNSTHMQYPRQLIFQIGHGDVPSPGILVSKSLFQPVWCPGVTELTITSKDSLIHGQRPGDFHYAVPVEERQAYTSLIEDLYLRHKENFVTVERLLLLWKIWSPVLVHFETKIPRSYEEGADNNLNFKAENEELLFIDNSSGNISNLHDSVLHDVKQTILPSDMIIIPATFRGDNLVCKDLDALCYSLSDHVRKSAEMAIQDRNVFHLALSGGNSPILLFKTLAQNFNFPWSYTHIWQVDERCVPQNSEKSNLMSLYQNLLYQVDIPFYNIHPLPVDINGRICKESDKGDKQYEDALLHFIADVRFDMIVLGLGSDGHTASLFPGKKYSNLLSTSQLVAYTQSNDMSQRMSLLLPILNKAREITVLVTGKSKHGILKTLSETVGQNPEIPITFVTANNGNLTWYVDYDAWIS